jgi:hypothetical protein
MEAKDEEMTELQAIKYRLASCFYRDFSSSKLQTGHFLMKCNGELINYNGKVDLFLTTLFNSIKYGIRSFRPHGSSPPSGSPPLFYVRPYSRQFAPSVRPNVIYRIHPGD